MDIWVWDLARETLNRLTFAQGTEQIPVWTSDSRRVVFYSDRGGTGILWWQAADGSGAAEPLATSPYIQAPSAATPDGTALMFSEAHQATGRDLMLVSLSGAHTVTPFLQTPFEERNGTVSPDGRWLAYESDSSGRLEVFGHRPGAEAQWQISTGGGAAGLGPSELNFHIDPNRLVRVREVEAGGDVAAPARRQLSTCSYAINGNISRELRHLA